MSWDYDSNCAGSRTALVPNVCEFEMEATGSLSLEVEIKEYSSSREIVLDSLETGSRRFLFSAFALRMEVNISTRSN
jgi:hypothetical protein